MTRDDDEVLRMLAASAGAEAPAGVERKPMDSGRPKLSFDSAKADEPQPSPGPTPEPAPANETYADIPSSVETGPTSPAKRAMDMGIAGLMIGVLWPVFALAALLIKLESPGPVLIRQKRVGLDGRTFLFFKFRSMHHRKNQDDLHERLPKGDLRTRLLSPRGRPLNATAVGWTLRKTTVDELPQLINVVRGEMSLVGPRPDIPAIVNHWPSEFRQRHQVKPGMTGLAQVNGRSDLTHYEKVKYDLRYVANHPITQDLKILLKTVGLVISKKGAR
jgi:lipopolysaccharide/colanic/teichoic acid biosynthesis glycosyltransferase